MDKDSVILRYLQAEVKDSEHEMSELKKVNERNEKSLGNIDAKMDEVYARLKMNRKTAAIKHAAVKTDSAAACPVKELSYDQLYQKAKSSLESRGLDVDSMDYHDLVSQRELDEITNQLNKPLTQREKWDKGDFVAVFVAASVGSLADIILSNRNNKLTGQDSDFSKWLDQFHKHEGGDPLDYQGPGFGGGYHRGLSKSHDVLRFIEAILMIKNGRFEGIRYMDGIGQKVVSTVNQYGTPYEQLGLIEAILKYAKHMFADLFSTCSLPFPGSSFLVESSSRDIRKLAASMYQNGFNLKNIMIQSLSTILVEVILRIYFAVKSYKKYKNEFEMEDDYSNIEAVKRFIKPENKEKLNEMLLMAHSIVTAVNIGKVVIKKSPWEINVTEIFSVIKYAAAVIKSAADRNSEYGKLIRNSHDIHERWEQLASEFSLEESEKDSALKELVIG
ncbi:MAG: hypothetical protein AAGU76_11505 [Sedimentibacter sp.]|uniref:hypothetical protein n=1 Tax=Sedimentibacter sp. TaxID=1960295 RepID=UPI0031582B4E